jgi:hypothetical protein
MLAVAVPLEGGRAFAIQYRSSREPDAAPDFWWVEAEVMLVGQISTKRSWGELKAHFGRSLTDASSGLVFGKLCSMPRISLQLDPPEDWWARRDETIPIPAASRVLEVFAESPAQHAMGLSTSTRRC